MKKKLIVLFFSVAVLFVFTACSSNSVAEVNGEKISKDEYKEYVNYLLISYDSMYASLGGLSPEMLQYFDIENTAINTLVTMEEAKQACAKVKCTPTEDEIQSYVYENLGVTEKADYQTAISQVETNYGLSEDTTVKVIASNLYKEKLEDYLEKKQDITFSEKEAKALYKEDPESYDNRTVSYILIQPDDTDATTDDSGNTVYTDEAWAAAKEEAKEVIAKLDDGGDFAELAKEYSDDSSTASDGGSIAESFTRSESSYVEEFTDAAFELTKVGAYTEKPVKSSSFGYFIILCDGLQDKDNDYDNLIASIVEDNLDTLKSDAYEEYISDFHEKSDVVYYYGDNADGTAATDESEDAATDSDTTTDSDTATEGE